MAFFIIAGAGSAGCVLANRLSEDPSNRVVLLEAGGGDGNILYRMPGGFLGILRSGMGMWNFETLPQEGLNGRTMWCPRGRVLGGSSSINAQVFVRGNKADFDSWSKGAKGWSYADCLPYFRRMERYSEGSDEFRGDAGPIGVTLAPPIERGSVLNQALVAAARSLGLPFTADFNGESQEGFARSNANYADGCRQSASAGYLRPIANRTNLKIITRARVLRVIVERNRAVGVEFRHRGRVRRLMTGDDVILSLGAIQTPQLLQLSGIGPADLLSRHKIPIVMDLPGVGRNFQDHLGVKLKQRITQPHSAVASLKLHRMAMGLVQYWLTGNGPGASNGNQLIAFLKTQASADIPDIQLHFPPAIIEDYGRRIPQIEGFSISVCGLHPRSRGEVRIASADPMAKPVIDPQYLSDEADVRVLRDGFKLARELVDQASFNSFRGTEYAPGDTMISDTDLDRYIRDTAETIYHPVGTCRMGDDDGAVVDPTTRVRGITGLRVVDASIMPTIVSGNTNAATMMIGERAADLILAA